VGEAPKNINDSIKSQDMDKSKIKMFQDKNKMEATNPNVFTFLDYE